MTPKEIATSINANQSIVAKYLSAKFDYVIGRMKYINDGRPLNVDGSAEGIASASLTDTVSRNALAELAEQLSKEALELKKMLEVPKQSSSPSGPDII